MIGLALGAMMAVGVMVALAVSAIAWFVLRGLIFLVTLPFRLLFAVIALPLLLLKIVLMAVAAAVLITLLAAGGLLIALGVVVGVLIPLLPILLVVGLTFAIVRLMRRPATI